jgi:anti-sigma factor RsiW
MTCLELFDYIVEYLDGSLPDDVCARFRDHLGECPNCDVYFKTYQLTVKAGRLAYLHEQQVVGPIPEELVQAILKTARTSGFVGH